MKKIHITLIGGQVLPVYLGIKDINPDEIIFICSEQSYKEATRIAKIFKHIQSYIHMIDPVDFLQIENKAIELLNTYKQENISLNLSSGTKPWSIIFYSIFRNISTANIIFIDQNNIIYDFLKKENHEIKFDKKIIFELNGTALVDYEPFSNYTEQDKAVCKELENIRTFNYNDFNSLTAVLNQEFKENFKKNIGENALENGSRISWNKKENKVNITLYNKKGKFITKELLSPHAISLTFSSGWFEYKVAEAISHNEHTQEIWMNCKFNAKNDAPKNEVDIIADMGTKFLFVECKTQIKSKTDIDKFRSVLKNFGGMGSKGIFVTNTTMDSLSLEKCRDNNINTFSFTPQNPLDPDFKTILEDDIQELNKTINENLDTINPK